LVCGVTNAGNGYSIYNISDATVLKSDNSLVGIPKSCKFARNGWYAISTTADRLYSYWITYNKRWEYTGNTK
jgi:hypothetical protein